MTKSVHELMIDEIIDKFNFERVHFVMTALDWQWLTTEGNGHAVPTLAKLKAMARHLLRESVADKQVGSGGFVATYHPKSKDTSEYFDLKFVLHHADSYDD
jgi:hypothetical protein